MTQRVGLVCEFPAFHWQPIKKLHRMVEFDKLLVSRWLRIEAKLQFAAFGSQLCFAADLLRRRFESTQTANPFHDPFGVQLFLHPFERSIDRLTFSHNYFGHNNSIQTDAFVRGLNSSRGFS